MTRKLRNVTITLDDETARWARLEAARHDTSVSRLVGSMLRREMQAHDTFERAKRQYMSQEPLTHRADGRPYPSRDQMHERDGLR